MQTVVHVYLYVIIGAAMNDHLKYRVCIETGALGGRLNSESR